MLIQEETPLSSEEVERQEVLREIWAFVPSLVGVLQEHSSDRAITSKFWLSEPPRGTRLWQVQGLPFLAERGLALYIGSNHEFYLNRIGTKEWWEAKIENRNLRAMMRLLAQLQQMDREAKRHSAYKSRH